MLDKLSLDNSVREYAIRVEAESRRAKLRRQMMCVGLLALLIGLFALGVCVFCHFSSPDRDRRDPSPGDPKKIKYSVQEYPQINTNFHRFNLRQSAKSAEGRG